MIRYHAALELIEGAARRAPLANESVPLARASGRILATELRSPEEVPSFTNSAMDGFALCSADTAGATSENPVRISVRGLVAAGDVKAFADARTEKRGIAVEIMTGAPVPEGIYDAVVRIEDVKVERSDAGDALAITLSKPVEAGANVRLRGTDFTVGQPVLPSGVRFEAEHILACASLGIREISVRTLPRVSILSTGSELVSPDEPTLSPGMIRNSTGPFLVAAFHRLGIEAHHHGVIADDVGLYRKVLEQAIRDGADVILSTGAVSMGKFDFVSDVITAMGAEIHFHKAAIRPGKPVLFATLEFAGRKVAFFGIPGNPVSTAVGLRFFVEPYLRAQLGLSRETPIPARLTRASKKPEGLRCFFKGRSGLDERGLAVEAIHGQASYVVSSMAEANCWVVFPESGGALESGTAVEVYPLQNSFERGVLS